MSRKMLMAIGAHADDIEFGAGGTISKYLEKGYSLVYVLSTNNMSGNWSSLDGNGERVSRTVSWREIQQQRKLEADRAAAHFGTSAIQLNYPQRHYWNDKLEKVELRWGASRPECISENIPSILTAHENPASVSALVRLIEEYQPEAVLTHDPIQRDMEHIGTSLLVTKAARQARYDGWLLLWPSVDEPDCGEIYTSRQTYIDISACYEKKMKALRIHSCQIPTTKHFSFRPFESGTGCVHVEAFAIAKRPEADAQSEFSQEILKNIM